MKKTLFITALVLTISVFSQEKFETNKKDSDYKFTVLKDLEATNVQSQGRTGTCWSFSSLSFFEGIKSSNKPIKINPINAQLSSGDKKFKIQ